MEIVSTILVFVWDENLPLRFKVRFSCKPLHGEGTETGCYHNENHLILKSSKAHCQSKPPYAQAVLCIYHAYNCICP